jgi:hypothetical protein
MMVSRMLLNGKRTMVHVKSDVLARASDETNTRRP